MLQSTFLPTDRMLVNCCKMSARLVSNFKSVILWYSSHRVLTIIRDHASWSLTRNRKQNISNFWYKKWSWSFQKFKWCWPMIEYLQQILDWETKRFFFNVVACGRWSLGERSILDSSVTYKWLNLCLLNSSGRRSRKYDVFSEGDIWGREEKKFWNTSGVAKSF